MRPLLLSAAGDRFTPLLRHSLPTFERFAAVHGYDVDIEPIDDAAGVADPAARRRARWRKVEVLAEAVERRPLVLWMDADAMFLRVDRDIATDLPDASFQGLVLEEFPERTNPNTGVWLLRGGRRAGAFLDEVLTTGLLDHSWSDQATVCAALGWSLGDHHGNGARHVRSTPHLAGTSWLPTEWNPLGAAAGNGGRVLHCAGLSLDERARIMARAADLVSRRAPDA